MDHSSLRAGDRQFYPEARNQSKNETFFSLKGISHTHRPVSVATEFVDIDWDEDITSDAEENSPRVSLQSPSITTVSSYDEAPTPRSSSGRELFSEAFLETSPKQVEGPRGPHLFRGSVDQSLLHEEAILTLSPLAPLPTRSIEQRLERPHAPRPSKDFLFTLDELDPSSLASWTPEMVAQFMVNAGIDLSVANRFVENDINGEILVTLKFEDLRELDIPSFGIRTRVWHQVQALRDSRPSSPRPSTPIEDAPSREARKEAREVTQRAGSDLERRQSSRRRHRRRPSAHDDAVTPMESVSIIGIEQAIPKPHHCSKGENCSKWKRQQRAIEDFKKVHPHVDMNANGTVLILGDTANPETAQAIDPRQDSRPQSDAIQSVVASSDILGPGGLPPLQYLQEAALRNVRSRDPQDNVRQFLNFQHQQNKPGANEVPPTPPFELAPSAMAPHHGLRRLPKLSIPAGAAPPRRPSLANLFPLSPEQTPDSNEHYPVAEQQGPVQSPTDRIVARSPDLETRRDYRRLGSPFSEMDVPVTALPAGPVSRDVSQSVPPDMGYRANMSSSPCPSLPRSQSRVSARRPSFPVLPAVDEHKAVCAAIKTPSSKSPSPKTPSPKTPSPKSAGRLSQQQPLQAPPRFNYPWSPVEPTHLEQTIPPPSTFAPSPSPQERGAAADGISFRGPMKKRKMRLFRHEWQDAFFTIRGTRLNMHKDSKEVDRTLEYIDIDDYAIACSNLASSSKLSAAFKAMHLSHSRGKSDSIAAFSFQLIPQDREATGLRLRKRDSLHASSEAPAEGVNGTGKTHHFAVKSRDERIDWMRELMLAKALKQKGEGFEISVNGNMI
ncbi:hypothetical protein CDD83_8771 [Cordyceps sp. RAO-2017]|nr:hypothetical protein CDD83_8771 [Cordyceps sp. RAO-2017]